jgi:hypothetical protein
MLSRDGNEFATNPPALVASTNHRVEQKGMGQTIPGNIHKSN